MKRLIRNRGERQAGEACCAGVRGIFALFCAVALFVAGMNVGSSLETGSSLESDAPRVLLERGDASSELVAADVASGLSAPFKNWLTDNSRKALGGGDFLFLPHRRTIWVVSPQHGRFVNYNIRSYDEIKKPGLGARGAGLKSMVVTLDPKLFPAADTRYLLSDRNSSEGLWVCNRRTGDVRIYVTRTDGKLLPEGEIVAPGLGTGDFEFLPNRRTMWIVNRTTGRFAHFDLRNDQERTVHRSQIGSVNLREFPSESTDFLLSDRNYDAMLWVCNRVTGVVQLWRVNPRGRDLILHVDFAARNDLLQAAGN
ncbi:MAG: hypothetical protein AAF517_27795 [Planctomycetota bacterium]